MCSKHSRYKAQRKPTSNCIECWVEFLEKNPSETILAADAAILICLILAELYTLKAEISGAKVEGHHG